MSVVQFALLLAIAAPFGLAMWVAVLHRRPHETSGEGAWAERMEVGANRPRFKAEILDLDAEVRAAADSLSGEAGTRFVQIQLAVRPGSRVRVDWDALWTALRSVLRTAIHATPGGQVLVTALAVGTEMHIHVIDDGSDADQGCRESLAREAQSLIALQGGAVAVEARPGRGTTVTIRLPLPKESPAEQNTAMAEPTLARAVI